MSYKYYSRKLYNRKTWKMEPISFWKAVQLTLWYWFMYRLLVFGFIDKPEGADLRFKYWRWDFWNSGNLFSVWQREKRNNTWQWHELIY